MASAKQNDAKTEFVIEVKDLCFNRGSRPIFNKLNLNIRRGQITVIMGPSGTGKTTLLRLIGGELKPRSGSIRVFGQQVNKLSQKDLYNIRQRMGVLFQQGALFTDLNVIDNVAFPLRQHTDLSDQLIKDLALLRLEAVGLRGAAKLATYELSGGMARRVALARSVIMDPEIMLYDEPFTGQDPITRAVLLELIQRLNSALGLTSVLVSHDIADSLSIADWVYIISEGKVLAEGKPGDLKNMDDPALQQFLLGKADGPVPFAFPCVPLEYDMNISKGGNNA